MVVSWLVLVTKIYNIIVVPDTVTEDAAVNNAPVPVALIENIPVALDHAPN